jgi:hypothetical protein
MLADLVQVFVNTVLPVFLVAGAGYILARTTSIDGRSVGRIIFYLGSPSLIFRSLYTMEISTTLLQHFAVGAGPLRDHRAGRLVCGQRPDAPAPRGAHHCQRRQQQRQHGAADCALCAG